MTALAATVLLVDDDPAVRDSLSQVLERVGYRVICAEHGAQGLELLRHMPRPSAIVLDLFMPEMNGWRFFEQLREREDLAQIPAIVVTGVGPHWGTPVPHERLLHKPFPPARLVSLLNELVRPQPE